MIKEKLPIILIFLLIGLPMYYFIISSITEQVTGEGTVIDKFTQPSGISGQSVSYFIVVMNGQNNTKDIIVNEEIYYKYEIGDYVEIK